MKAKPTKTDWVEIDAKSLTAYISNQQELIRQVRQEAIRETIEVVRLR